MEIWYWSEFLHNSKFTLTSKIAWNKQCSLLRGLTVYRECEGGIEKVITWITVWHHEAFRVMTNGDGEEQIF